MTNTLKANGGYFLLHPECEHILILPIFGQLGEWSTTSGRKIQTETISSSPLEVTISHHLYYWLFWDNHSYQSQYTNLMEYNLGT